MLLTLSGREVQDFLSQNSTNYDDLPYCKDGVPMRVFPGVRVVVGITCILSMFGAVMIILSYFLIPEIRTKAREILVHLSLMDFMAAAANFAGIVANFDQYLFDSSHPNMSDHTYNTINNLCIAQATFAMYGTVSSILWTICLAVYIYFRIMYEQKPIAKKVSYGFYLLCYGLPLLLTLWFVLSSPRKLGYAKYGGSGWCSVIVSNSTTGEKYPFNAVFANDIWVYLTIILVPLILFSVHFYLRHEMRHGKAVLTGNLAAVVRTMEMKLLFIPLIFILLRIWSLLFVLIEIEYGDPHNPKSRLPCGAVLFFLHMGGIGDSGQGFANAILFCVFTPKVRRYFFRALVCHCIWGRNGVSINTPSSGGTYGSIAPVHPYPEEFSEESQTITVSHDQEDVRDTKSLLAASYS